MSWRDDVRRAKEALDWIEARQGPLPADGYARIQTTVGQVRAMAEQDDARVQEIRARLEAATPGPWKGEWDGQQYAVRTLNGDEIIEYTFAIPTWGERYEQAKATCDIGDAAFIAHSREDVPYLLARLDVLAAERDAARAWSARWKAVAKRLWAGIHKSLDQSERLAARMLKAVARAERAETANCVLLAKHALEDHERSCYPCSWPAQVPGYRCPTSVKLRTALAAASEAAQEGRVSGRCDTCGEVGYVWCGECNGPHPDDAVATREKLRAENARLTAQLAERDAEIAAWVDVADDLLSHPTPATDDAGCWFCDGGLGNGPNGHKDACAWRRMRAALAQADDGGRA